MGNVIDLYHKIGFESSCIMKWDSFRFSTFGGLLSSSVSFYDAHLAEQHITHAVVNQW